MHTVVELFRGQSHLLTTIQIVLDVCLILLVLLLLTRRSRNTVVTGHEELASSLEKIITETKEIATEFDANLQERKVLIQHLLSKLDGHLEEARRVAHQLELIQTEAQRQLAKEPAPRGTDHHEILRLAREGHDAQDIAARLKKPLGEVELTLKLRRLSDK